MLVSPSFFPLRTYIGVLTHLAEEICKTTKKLLNLQKWYQKNKFFSKEKSLFLKLIVWKRDNLL